MGICVSRIKTLEEKCDMLNEMLMDRQIQSEKLQNHMAEYVQHIRMRYTESLMKSINPKCKDSSVYITPEHIIHAPPRLFRDIGIAIPLEAKDRELFWISFFNAKGVNLPVIRHMDTNLGAVEIETFILDNPLLVQMCRDQRLIEYAEIFLNVLFFQDLPEPLERKSEIVGLTFRNHGAEGTFNHGVVTVYNLDGPVTRPISERKLKLQLSLIQAMADKDNTADRCVIEYNSWITYLSVNNTKRCNLVESLFGPAFARLVKIQNRFNSCGKIVGHLTWEEFVIFMDRAYVSIIQPPLSHTSKMGGDINHPNITLPKWNEAYKIKERNKHSDLLWKNCLALQKEHITLLVSKLQTLFYMKGVRAHKHHYEINLDVLSNLLAQKESELSNELMDTMMDLQAILALMQIDIEELIISLDMDSVFASDCYITIEHVVMAIKLLAYGNTFWELSSELSYMKKDDPRLLIGLGESNRLTENHQLSEFRLLCWLHDIAISDTAIVPQESILTYSSNSSNSSSGNKNTNTKEEDDDDGDDDDVDYSNLDETDEDLSFHRRFTFVIEGLEDWKSTLDAEELRKLRNNSSDTSNEMVITRQLWVEQIIPRAVAKWHSLHRIAYDSPVVMVHRNMNEGDNTPKQI